MEREKEKRSRIYIVCGKTDMRKGIDGLAAVVSEHIERALFSQESMFLFCGGKKDRYKALYWEGDGFTLLYKRIESGKLKWPKEDEEAIRLLEEREYRWLLEGLSIIQPKAIKEAGAGELF